MEQTDAELLVFLPLICFITFYFLLQPCFICPQQSFWLICQHILPVWMVEEVSILVFTAGGPFSAFHYIELPLIGNNKLALCVWHNLFSI